MTRFAFRTRASMKYGSGHLARTKWMIAELSRRGVAADRISVIVECDDIFADTIRCLPGQVSRLPEGVSLSDETMALSQHDAQLVVCDLLAPSPQHLQKLKDAFGKLVFFADEGNIDAQADIAFCPQLLAVVPRPISFGQRVYYGPDYFVLDNKVRDLQRAKRSRGYTPEGLLICLGGSAWSKTIEIVIDALERIGPGRFRKISWVTGRIDAGRIISDLRARLPWVNIVEFDQNLLQRLCEAEIAVTGGGFLKYEAAAVGTPALILALVDHQRTLSKVFCESGTAEFIGQFGSVSGQVLAKAIMDLVDDKARQGAMASRGMALLDGNGAARICDVILGKCRGAA